VAPRLLAITRGDTETQIYVRGSGEATWDSVARVMGKLSSSGFTKISLVTDTMGKPAAEPESVTP
jgi:biopolymer transport protein TolR